MTEREFVRNIQTELNEAFIAFCNDDDYLGCCINQSLKEINDLNLNIDTLITECNHLNISVEYANKMKSHQKYWLKIWNQNPCLVFSSIS